MYEDPKSKISQLEKVLDAREDKMSGLKKRHELHDRETSVSQNWDENEFKVEEKEESGAPAETRAMSSSVKILIGSVIFFVVALGFVAYKFLGGGNVVSGDNIAVTVKAPISVAGGETFPFEVEVKNNNSVTLSGVDMGITFPPGARDAANVSLSAKRVQDFLGDILPGQSAKKDLSVILVGTENEQENINITLEYKVPGSNSLFNKTKTVSVLVTSSPVNIVVTGPAEVNTNQSVDFTVDVTSNSPSLLKNLLLSAQYPFGFSFTRSTPATYTKNNLWFLGDLAPGAKRTIKFSGVLTGQEGEERGFNFSLGTQSAADNSVIETPFTSSFSSVTIRRPFVSADITLNGADTAEYVALAGTKVEAIINWQNNLPSEVTDASFTVRINGNAIDKSSVQADGGFYRSVDNTIVFNKTTDPLLAKLEPGEAGVSKFAFSSWGAQTITGASLTNPTITLDISVAGQQVGNPGGVLFSDSRKVKITANPQLFAKALYYVGPFQNSGPIPPKAESETTYTITWTVTNPLNNLSNAQVTAALPLYMKWLGTISPAQEKINYDQGTGLITWSLGNISAGAGIISPAREVSFQVSFLPSVDQIGTAPDLIGDAALSAKDNFTLTGVANSFSAVNTRLNNDPYFKVDSEMVVK